MTLPDAFAVVHRLPSGWGLSSYKMLCGYDLWDAHPVERVVTCLRCLVAERRRAK